MSTIATDELTRVHKPRHKTIKMVAAVTAYTAGVAALTVALQNTTKLVDGIPSFKESVIKAVGPVYATRRLPDKKLSASAGGTSDGTKAGGKTVEECVYPSDGATLVDGTGAFVPTLRSAGEPLVGWKVMRNDAYGYCVKIWASTGAKEILQQINGYLTATERYEVKR